MRAIAIIPARIASSRFPGKPLAKILGMPMVGHIYKRTKMAKNVDEVYVATCDKVIYDYIVSIGGKAIMTKDTHERATERIGEAVEKIMATGEATPDIIVMVQGDEPLIHPDTIDAMVRAFARRPEAEVINLTNEISSDNEYDQKNIVKLVYNDKGRAIWFFRQPSPFWRDKVRDLPIKIQTGIIAFRRQALTNFNSLAPTPFEKANSVDMYRLIEHGFPIYTLSSKRRLYSVDTPEDLAEAEKRMKVDETEFKLWLKLRG